MLKSLIRAALTQRLLVLVVALVLLGFGGRAPCACLWTHFPM